MPDGDDMGLAELAGALAALRRAAQEEDGTARALGVVAAVQLALRDLGLRPVVVGGLAVEFWTHSYATYDIDVLLPSEERVHERLAALGFERRGRIWTHPEVGVEWEMPGSVLDVLDQAVEVEVPGEDPILMLRCEDLLVHRIEEFVGGGHPDVFEQALALFARPSLDLSRVHERARAVNHEHAVDALQRIAADVQQGASAPETWDLIGLATNLRREWATRNRNA